MSLLKQYFPLKKLIVIYQSVIIHIMRNKKSEIHNIKTNSDPLSSYKNSLRPTPTQLIQTYQNILEFPPRVFWSLMYFVWFTLINNIYSQELIAINPIYNLGFLGGGIG